jgi:hypothetical protein
VGVAGDSNNSVTLLLDKIEATSTAQWNSSVNTNTYNGSTISTAMNTFANSTLSTNEGIIARTLTGGSENYLISGYYEDNTKGSNVADQKVWPLSVYEASHLIVSTRGFTSPYFWWLRSPGNMDGVVSIVEFNGSVDTIGYGVDNEFHIRPALYLDINSSVFSGLTFDARLPIGACQAVYTNLGIDYNAETITGFDTGNWSTADAFAGLTTPSPRTTAPVDISANISASASTLFYFKAADNTDSYFNSNTDSNGVAQESKSKLVIPARPAGPSVTGVAPSSPGASDGKITGASNKMEYSTDEISWTAVGGFAITGLTSGTYFVRMIADQSTSKFKSFATEVIVKEGSSPSSGPSAEPTTGPGSGQRPSAGDGGFSSEGTAKTGVDFVGLGLLVLLMLAFSVIARSRRRRDNLHYSEQLTGE